MKTKILRSGLTLLLALTLLAATGTAQGDVTVRISEATINQTIGAILDTKALNFSRFTFSYGVSYYGVSVESASINLLGGTGNNMDLSLYVHGRTSINLLLFRFDIVANANITMTGRVTLVPQGQGYRLVLSPQAIKSFTWTGTFLDNLIQDAANGYLAQQPEFSLVSYTSLLPAVAGQYFVSGTPVMNVTANEIYLSLALGPPGVSISGPSSVIHPEKGQPVNTYTWSSSVVGGASPYSYLWKKTSYGYTYNVGTSPSYTESYSFDGFGGGYSDFTLTIEVRDALNQLGSASKAVREYHSGGGPIEERKPGDLPTLALVPEVFNFAQNYPNPFNPETEIRYDLPEAAYVQIVVFDLLGRKAATLVEGNVKPGFHVSRWNGTDESGQKVKSGIYFCRMSAVGDGGQEYSRVMKMTLTK